MQNQRDMDSYQALSELFEDTLIRTLRTNDKYVIISDVHLGNGRGTDDCKRNGPMLFEVMNYYYENGFHLILNGDIEELLRFELHQIQRNWQEFYRILDMFHKEGRLTKIAGNHDLELLDRKDYPFPIFESLRLRFRENEIFIFHGHQMSRRLRRSNPIVNWTLRYIATPLRIRNVSVSQDSKKKYGIEKRIYHFSANHRIMSIIGHTHRPLFESMSKIDSIRFEIERLCRKYPKVNIHRQREIEIKISTLRRNLEATINKDRDSDLRESLYNANLVVPCMFNSGTVIGKRGMTNLEISNDAIRLVHWADERRGSHFLGDDPEMVERLGTGPFFRVLIKEDELSYIFSRIRLLGGGTAWQQP